MVRGFSWVELMFVLIKSTRPFDLLGSQRYICRWDSSYLSFASLCSERPLRFNPFPSRHTSLPTTTAIPKRSNQPWHPPPQSPSSPRASKSKPQPTPPATSNSARNSSQPLARSCEPSRRPQSASRGCATRTISFSSLRACSSSLTFSGL